MFGIDRLKYLCERFMLTAITIDSVPYLLHSADIYQAAVCFSHCFFCNCLVVSASEMSQFYTASL